MSLRLPAITGIQTSMPMRAGPDRFAGRRARTPAWRRDGHDVTALSGSKRHLCSSDAMRSLAQTAPLADRYRPASIPDQAAQPQSP